MKSSLILATVFVATAGAAGAAAVHFTTSPYVGSDTQLNIQNQAIENSGLGDTNWTPLSATADYTGGGSGAGETAMAKGTQYTAPMSRMLKGGAGKNACSGTQSLTEASGIVIGIDAARIFASTAVINGSLPDGGTPLTATDGGSLAGNQPTCNGGTVNPSNFCTSTVGGLAYDTSQGNPALNLLPGNPIQNWRDVLALLYGGLDKDDGLCADGTGACNPYNLTCASGAVCNPVTDCTSARRQALVNNWSALFENPGCNPPNGNNTPGVLTHAFRRDDNSGTSDVFAKLLGMESPSVDQYNNPIAGFSVSSEAINAFGTTPYCNALNWDTAEANANKCSNAVDLHFIGPGGLPLPSGTDTNCAATSTGATRSGGLCHHVPPFTCSAQLLCNNGTHCTTLLSTTQCADGSVCQFGTDNKCPLNGGAQSATNPAQTVTAATWGSVDYGTQSFVFPTSYQDNDPIRTACAGTGARSPAEDVCNTDGHLGVVLPIPPLDFVPAQNKDPAGNPLGSYTGGPTAASTCQTTFPNGTVDPGQNVQCGNGSPNAVGAIATTYLCAPKAQKNNFSPCPNNDYPPGALGCAIPTGASGSNGATSSFGPTSSCWAIKSTNPACVHGQTQDGGTTCSFIDGRAYNLHIYNGVGSSTTVAQYVTFSVGGVTLDDTGGFARIHQKDTMVSGLSVCHLTDATQQIGCLVNSDPQAIGYGGNPGDTWESADPLGNGQCSGETTGLRVHELAAGVSCTPAPTGSTQPTYPLWQKLYMSSVVGFANIPASNVEELELTGWESSPEDIGPIMAQYNEFVLPFSPNTAAGNQSDAGAGAQSGANSAAPFCEDFNEYLNGCAPDGGLGNLNGCAFNVNIDGGLGQIPSAPAPVVGPDAAPVNSTVCGDGLIEDYEDCDPGTPATATSPAIPAAPLPANCGTCSTVCRCSTL